MDAIQKDRFRKLIAAVENAPDERFDMGVWFLPTPCGTTACAAGHYVLANPGCGLKLAIGAVLDEQGLEGSRALATHFGIDRDEAVDLFVPDDDTSRQEVLARLRAFAADNDIGLAAAPEGVNRGN